MHVTENEIMAIGRKQMHMDINDNLGGPVQIVLFRTIHS